MTTHNLHILLGNGAEQNICRIQEYVIKYGNEYVDEAGAVASDYLQLLLYSDDCRFYRAVHDTSVDSFVSGIEDSYRVELTPEGDSFADEGSDAKLEHFFVKLFKQSVNLNRPGDKHMHVCLHVPMYEANAWAMGERLLAAITASGANYTIDLMLTGNDLAHLTIKEESRLIEEHDQLLATAKSTLGNIIKCKSENRYPKLNSLILVQNENMSGLALNLTDESYTNLMGEYALATTTAYNDIYTMNFLNETKVERPVLGLGLSMLNFDRYYFVQYMLHKAYVHILDRENITQESVDINKASNIVQRVLKDKIGIFTRIYNEVLRMRDERKLSNEDIVAEITPIIDKEIERVEREVLTFIDDDSLSLPEKRGTLAQLLGEDDVLLEGVLFNDKQLVLSDCRNDILSLFVNANNELAKMPEEALDGHAQPIRSHAILSDEEGVPVTSSDIRVERIRGIKNDIKVSTDYIRRQEAVLAGLERNIQQATESQKCLTPDGFIFQGQTYRLLPKNIERPLEEDYEPMVGTLPNDVDLRPYFTSVKDQGRLGSCTSFATVSVYEYFVRRNSGKEVDLSEMFVYYNTLRRSQTPEDGGTSIYQTVKAMGEDGVCLEKFHPYSDSGVNEPSVEAVNDAATRKVTKALNVKCSLNDIKSAVAQGYPVIIALDVFEGLNTPTGFVARPTDEERAASDDNSHAMVICGYSDPEKVFIVRNSWGVRFGDKGYCYIPYSYITDPELMHQATIITQISEAEVKALPDSNKASVSFNKNDANVQAAILRTLVDEERANVKYLTEQHNELIEDYFRLEAELGKSRNRRELCEGTQSRLKWEVERLKEHKTKLSDERIEQLEGFDAITRRFWFYSGIAVAATLIIYFLMMKLGVFGFTDLIYAFILLGFASAGFAYYIFRETKPFVPANHLEDFQSRVRNVWTVWGVGIIFFFVVCIFVWFFTSFHLLNTTFGWTILAALSYVPYVLSFVSRSRIRKQIDHEYKSKITAIANNIDLREREHDILPVKMESAGMILDKLTKLITNLNGMNHNLRSYVDNLRQWRKENAEKGDMQPVNRQPFMSLIKNECLDEYFDKHKDVLTSDVRLSQLFRDSYSVDEEQITSFKRGLKERLAKSLWSKVTGFSIYDHVTGTRTFEYVDSQYVDIGQLLKMVDDNSEIFVNTRMRMYGSNSQYANCKLLLRSAPGIDGGRNWDSNVQSYFSTKPQMLDLSSDYKIVVIRLEGLSPDELELLH